MHTVGSKVNWPKLITSNRTRWCPPRSQMNKPVESESGTADVAQHAGAVGLDDVVNIASLPGRRTDKPHRRRARVKSKIRTPILLSSSRPAKKRRSWGWSVCSWRSQRLNVTHPALTRLGRSVS